MNHSPFWPLVWKEYRAGRAFWLAMAGMGLVAQGGVAWLAHQPADRNWWLYGIALMISAGFAVGIGGTLFAVEHEERTFALMRILPLGAKVLGAAKILCALAGLAGLLAVLWLTAGAMTGWQSLSPHDAGRLWGLWGLACLEGMAWGVLCSLVFSSPLRATVIALLAVTLSIQAAVILTSRHDLADIAAYSEAIPFRLVLLLIVGGLDAWLMPRWLAGRSAACTRSAPDGKNGPAREGLCRMEKSGSALVGPFGPLDVAGLARSGGKRMAAGRRGRGEPGGLVSCAGRDGRGFACRRGLATAANRRRTAANSLVCAVAAGVGDQPLWLVGLSRRPDLRGPIPGRTRRLVPRCGLHGRRCGAAG